MRAGRQQDAAFGAGEAVEAGAEAVGQALAVPEARFRAARMHWQQRRCGPGAPRNHARRDALQKPIFGHGDTEQGLRIARELPSEEGARDARARGEPRGEEPTLMPRVRDEVVRRALPADPYSLTRYASSGPLRPALSG